jgi:hypothetical protein
MGWRYLTRFDFQKGQRLKEWLHRQDISEVKRIAKRFASFDFKYAWNIAEPAEGVEKN